MELLNAYAANHDDNSLLAVLWTLVAGLFFGVPSLLVAWFYIRRNRGNLGLCIWVGLIAVVMTVFWVAFLLWGIGGSSIHPGHPVKVH